MTNVKRFSLRQGIERIPEQPLFEDAPDRIRFFILEYLKNNFYDYVARETVGRALCIPDLITANGLTGQECWRVLQGHLFGGDWWQIYNILEETYIDLANMGDAHSKRTEFVQRVNQTFSDENVGWNMDSNGRLQRTLPEAIRAEEETIFKELRTSRFQVAFAHLQSSRKAYNARPRRNRDVCSESFDALESVAKEVFSLPTGTFGDVIKRALIFSGGPFHA